MPKKFLQRIVFLFLALPVLCSLIVLPELSVHAQDPTFDPIINKSFSSIVIDPGGISTLTIKIANPNTTPLTNTAFIDDLESNTPGLKLADPVNLVYTCVGVGSPAGTVTADPGGTTIQLAGGEVPGKIGSVDGECNISVDVTSTYQGTIINTIPGREAGVSVGGLTAMVGAVAVSNVDKAEASIRMRAMSAPTVTKKFAKNTIYVGEVTTLTIDIKNTDGAIALTEVSLIDTLPGAVVLASTVSPIMTGCDYSSTPTLAAVSGASSLTISNASIAQLGTCRIVVNVSSPSQGINLNIMEAGTIHSKQGVTNTSPASDPLNVQAVRINKAFSPATIQAGEISTLTIDLFNPTSTRYTGVSLADILPGTVLEVVDGSATTNCVGTASTTLPHTIALTDGEVPPGTVTSPGSCWIKVNVTTPDAALNATYTNRIPASGLVTDQLITNALETTAPITVRALSIGVNKAFAPARIQQGGTSEVRITLNNPTLTVFTGVRFIDTLPPGLVAVLPAVTTTTCAGGTVDVTSDPTVIDFTGGTVPARSGTIAGSCYITVKVTTNGSSFPATYRNTIINNTIYTNEGITNLADSYGEIDVYPTDAGITFTKTFAPSSILAGGNSHLQIVMNAPQDEDLTNFSISDNLPSGMTISNSTAPKTTGCGVGAILTANTTESLITLSEATILKNTTCTLDVYVTAGVSNSYVNTINPADFVNDQGQKPPSAKSATLLVSNLTISKAFYPAKVSPGGKSTLTITLTNTNNSPLTSVALTDYLSSMGGTAVILASPVNTTSNCGLPSFSYPNSQTFSMTGATIPPQVLAIPGVCTISFDVVATGAAQTRTNTIARSDVSGMVFPSGSLINPVANATAPLVISPLSLGVVKGFAPVTVFGGSSSTLSLKIINQNNAVLTGITLTDLMPVGMLVATPADLSTGTCGGTLTAASGGRSITFSGGRLEALQICTLTLKITMNVIGNRTNTIQVGEVTSFNGASNDQAASASLSNLPGASVTKYFLQDSIVVGNYTLLTIRITNTGNVALSGMGLTDTLPGTAPAGTLVIAGAPAPGATTTCDYGPPTAILTANPGEQTITLANGKMLAGPNTTCDIVVPVTSTTSGTYTNVIAKNSLLTDEQATNTQPAQATLIVTADPSLKLVKTIVNSGPFGGGDTINFKITATNNGNVPLTNVVIADTGVGASLGVCAPINGSSLASGAEMICDASYVVQAADVTAGTYSNTATADSDETPPISDSVVVPISPSALSITKSIITPAPYALGDTLTYEIRAKNIGNTPLTNVVISDTSAALGICSPVNGSGLIVGAEMVCPAAHVISATDVAALNYTNTATGDSTETTPLSDTVMVQITRNPAMEIYKTVTSDGPYSVGSLITFDISVINTGDVTLHTVQIMEVSGDAVLGTCPAVPLVPNEVVSCSATHTVTVADMSSGGYSNTASADSDETDPVLDTEIVITKAPKIELTKTGVLDMSLFGSANVADVGDTITYTFTVKNSGEVTLTNLNLYELVSGVTITSGAPIPDLAAGASTTLTGLYTLTQDDINSNTFTNTAIATGDPPIGNPVSAPAADTKNNLAEPSLNLVKTITSGGDYNQVGAVIFYSYTLKNDGNVALSGNGAGGLFTITDNYLGEFTCGTATSLAINASITCTNSYTVTQTDLDTGNSIMNMANGHGKFGLVDVVSNEATATATESLSWNATLAKTLETTEINAAGNDNTQAVIGEILTYKLVASFPPGSTVSARIVDTLDAGLAFVAVDSVTVSDPDADGGSGDTDTGLNSSKMTFEPANSLCTNCTAGTNGAASNPFVENSGGKLTFDFGKIINTNMAEETITILYRVMVLNVSTNQSTTTPLRNTAIFSWTGASITRSASSVSIVEPNVNITKTVDILNGVDAGNLLTYTVILTNPALLPAFDATLSDAFPYNATTLASQLENITITNVTDTDLVMPITAANFTIVCDDAPTCAAPNRWTLNTLTPFDMPQNRTITLTITANVSPTTFPNAVIDNYSQMRWTSMDGVFLDRSGFVTGPSDSERTGADGPAGLLNDYAKQSPAVARTTLTNLAGTKYYMASSEAGTSDVAVPPRVAIGEVVRYRIALRLNEGTMPDLSMLDNLPPGMRFINDGQARVAFVSNGAGITSTTINSSLSNCADLNVAGTVANTGLPSTSITCPLPDTAVSGGVNSRTSNVDAYASGTDVYFKFGNILNSDNDASDEFIVVEFNAVVENLSSNQAQDNLAGGVSTLNRANDFQAYINTSATPAPTALFTAAAVNVRVVEPAITDLVKGVSVPGGDAGDLITYTLTFSNVNSLNAAPAYDVVLTDSVPAKMIVAPIIPATDITFTPAACGILGSNTTTGNAITLTFTSLNVGCAVSVRYYATLQATVMPGEILTNTAAVNYSSLPGPTGTTPNPSGSNTPGASGTATGERNGTGGQGADGTTLNNYRDSATTPVIITAFQPVKSIVSTTAAHTSETGNGSVGNARDLTIGEVIRYRLAVMIPEGTISQLQLRDTLPAGFTYLNDGNTRIALIANSNMTAENDLSGANTGLLPPTFVLPSGRISVLGQAVTFTIADLVNPIDLVNNDNDVDAEFLVIDFNVRINNDGNNNNTDLDGNNFEVVVGATTAATSNGVVTRIVEPLLNLTKSVDDTTWSYGQTLDYSLSLTHTVDSLTPAQDVFITDRIPSGLTYVSGSITKPVGWVADDTNAPELTWTCAGSCSMLTTDGLLEFTYQARVDDPPVPPALPGGGTATNTASVTWSSLSGTDSNERTYTDSASVTGSLNEYRYALGNRIWFDTNNNGLIDNDGAGGNADELGVNNVRVDLYKEDGTGNLVFQNFTTTSNGGYYLFDYLAAGDYVVVIPSTDFNDNAVLEGYHSSGAAMSLSGAIIESAAPLSNTDIDVDDNGLFQTAGGFMGGVSSSVVTLGESEPINESDLNAGSQGVQPDNRANMTVDFGFYRTAIGNQVWFDENVDGRYTAGETLINAAEVKLVVRNGAIDTEILVGPDGMLGTSDDLAGNVTTDINGVYSFNGLPEGDYIVKVAGPAGTLSTLDTFNLADTTTPTNVDDNDNGIGKISNSISSGNFTMDAGSPQNSSNQNNGTTTNSTLDFGFVYPYAFGNRVWFDTNNNAQIDAPEFGAANVTVELYSTADLQTIVDTTTTNAAGYYLFDRVFPGEYVIVIPSTNFVSGVLTGYWSSGTQRGIDGSIAEATAPDADTDIDSDDNGTLQTSGGLIGAVTSGPVTIGPFGLVEPTKELDLESGVGQGTQPDGRANLTIDFGFYRVEVGNLIYSDGDQSGDYEAANDVALPGVRVQLYVSDGITETEVNIGPDGILRTPDDAPGGVVSDGNGLYLLSGLPQGIYLIKVTSVAGTSSTIDTYNADGDTVNPNVNADNNDNGIGIGSGIIASGLVTLTPGSSGAPGYDNNIIDNISGTTNNPTLDFGFIPAFSLGNRVWFDTNNNSQINVAEVGVGGVDLELYNADASGGMTTSTGRTATTSVGGYYLFDNLPAGNYVVVIPASNFNSGGALNGYWSSGITRAGDGSISELPAALSNTDNDSDDNGSRLTGGIFDGAVISSFVSLGPNINTEPFNELDLGPDGQGQPDRQANMTVDFGFYTIQLGDQVWNDVDNSGLLDGTETGMFNVTVELWPADGSGVAPLATVVTDVSGKYVFTGLPRGDYLLRIPHTEFEGSGALRDYVSSTGGALNPYEPAPDPDSNFTDSDDNGTELGGTLGLGGSIQSPVVSLTPAGEQSVDHVLGLTNEPRVDFGIFNNPRIDLSITKTDKTSYYLAGGTLSYEIIVTNQGPADVSDAGVTDLLPAQISTWSWECGADTPAAYKCTGAPANSFDFTDLLDLPSGASVTYDVSATVKEAATGNLTNLATIDLPSGSLITESITDNNTAQDLDTLASLTVTKDDGIEVAGPNSSLTYIITVQNTGDADLTSVTATDTLPDDLIYQNASPAPTTISGNTLAWTGLSLEAGSSMTISVTALVRNSPSNAAIPNRVDVIDANTGANAAASDVDFVVFNSNFTKTLAATSEGFTQNSEVAIGEVVTYELTANLAAGLMFNQVVITDRMEKGLAFVECSSVTLSGTDITNSVCPPTISEIVDFGDTGNAANPGRQVQFNIGDIAANQVASTLVIRYRAIVLDVIENQEKVGLNNTASWTWFGGSVSANADEVMVVEPDLAIDKSALPISATAGTAIEFTLTMAHTAQSSADAFDVAVNDILPAGLEYIACAPISYSGLLPTAQPDPCLVTGGNLSFVWDSFPRNETATIKFFARYSGLQPTLTNSATLAWSSLPIDPSGSPPVPQQLSAFNSSSTERWYDPLDLVNVYQVVDSVTINPLPTAGKSKAKFPNFLPATGFAPDVITYLLPQPADKLYSVTDIWIEIPTIGVNIPIVGVPLVNNEWDVSWLWQQAGWLNGTAFPGWQGNSVLTGHVMLPNGKPGPFEGLNTLKWGDKIIVHTYGFIYNYEVRENLIVTPNNTSVLSHSETSWLTLLTCKTYNEITNSYTNRIAVRAVLLEVGKEKP